MTHLSTITIGKVGIIGDIVYALIYLQTKGIHDVIRNDYHPRTGR